MTRDNYILYLQGTISNYPSKNMRHLKKLFVEAGIAQIEDQLRLENTTEDCIDVRDLEIGSQLERCIKEVPKAIEIFEKWEFEKDYKYSVLFETNGFDDILVCVCANVDTLKGTDESENMSNEFELPIRYSTKDKVFVKFDFAYGSVNTLTGQELFQKSPILIVFHKQEKFIEFRFDAIQRVFIEEKKEQTIYADIIKDLIYYCEVNFGAHLAPVNLDFMTESNEQAEFRVMGQYSRLPNGGNAQLEVGKNQDYVLPIIGDLKELLKRNMAELEKIPQLKEELDQFIFENDELADYSWIEVMWENDLKTRNIRVKFIFNYKNSSYCLLQHYFSTVLIGMERMNHVVKYISQHRPNATTEV